jgi:hypothetical protein
MELLKFLCFGARDLTLCSFISKTFPQLGGPLGNCRKLIDCVIISH